MASQGVATASGNDSSVPSDPQVTDSEALTIVGALAIGVLALFLMRIALNLLIDVLVLDRTVQQSLQTSFSCCLACCGCRRRSRWWLCQTRGHDSGAASNGGRQPAATSASTTQAASTTTMSAEDPTDSNGVAASATTTTRTKSRDRTAVSLAATKGMAGRTLSTVELMEMGEEECTICLQDLKHPFRSSSSSSANNNSTAAAAAGSVTETAPCQHRFHSDCLQDWIDNNNNTDKVVRCPNCRTPLSLLFENECC
jgi:Ring finger domain